MRNRRQARQLVGHFHRFKASLSTASTPQAIGGIDVPVLYADKQPTLVGVDQINVRLPRSLAGKGDVDLVVTVDGKMANRVNVNIK